MPAIRPFTSTARSVAGSGARANGASQLSPCEPEAPRTARVALVGNPNVGKSVLFGLLSGRYVTVSNYPGTTVEVARGTMAVEGRRVSIIDTPGVNGLVPQSEDERVTRDLLLEGPATVLQVADAKNLPRALALALQIGEAGLPSVLCLNMSDEAESLGIQIDTDLLSRTLGVQVVLTVATRRKGISQIPALLASARVGTQRVEYGPSLEAAAARIEPLMPRCAMSARALAMAALSGDQTLAEWFREVMPDEDLAALEDALRAASRSFGTSLAFAVQERRVAAAEDLARRVAADRAAGSMGAARWGDLTMHRVWGIPVVAAALYVTYLFVGVLGAQTAVGWVEGELFGSRAFEQRVEIGSGGAVEGNEGTGASPRAGAVSVLPPEAPPLSSAAVELRIDPESRVRRLIVAADPPGSLAGQPRATDDGAWIVPITGTGPAALTLEGWNGWINPAVRSFLLDWSPSPILTEALAGPYGLITMGLTYAIAIVLPIVVTFFFAFSVLEDSGYLPRLAVMLNRLFRVMGLNGRAVLPMVLGLGCDTMATLTTRILGTRKERLLVILLLALGVPCSAQLGVVLGLLAGLSWKATAVWAGVVASVVLVVGYVAAAVIPGERSRFIMEIPPLRFPSPGNLIRKTMARVEWYLKEAVPLFLLGTLLLFVADKTAALRIVEDAARPVVTTLLGLPAAASQAFVLGFLRRDFGAAGLYRLAQDGGLDAVQIVVSLVTMTLFMPCIANFFMIIKEQGTRVALLVAGLVFPLAVLVGAALRLVLRLLGADLT